MSHRRPTPTRRGIALLLVLATLLLAVTAACGLARVATNARLRAERAREGTLADGLLRAADEPILDWLHRHAGRLVLPPDAGSPRFTVVDDQVVLEGEGCRIRISAFDQCGMVPSTARTGEIDSTLPADMLDYLDRAGEAYALHPGLDLLALVNAGNRAVFPEAEQTGVLAIGELVATHNPPPPPPQANATPSININTAPLELVAAAYAARGLGGLEAVVEARAAGRIASPGAMEAPRTGNEEDTPLPVATSGCWAFRVDCRAGRVRRSWWCVYADTGSNWERVQRLAIDE